MAVSATLVRSGKRKRIWTIIATADADTGLTFAHGLLNPGGLAADINLTLTPILQAPAALSLWAGTADATNIILVKSTAGSSGNAAAQLRVMAESIHTMGG